MAKVPTKDDVLEFLAECRRQAGAPMIGCAEWEVARAWPEFGQVALHHLTTLRREGRIQRGTGFCWITEDAFAQLATP